ncbi:hypothetical protein BaRGS_00023199, partial [Batillaria attramentaria]
LDLQQCVSNVIEVDETSSSNVVTCRGAGQNEDITWKYISASGATVNIGTCPPSGLCSNANPLFSSTRSPSSTSSQLTFKLDIKTYRSQYGGMTLICDTPSTDEISCQLDVIHRAEVTSCSAQSNTSGTQWTVGGTCAVSKAYSERNRYSCAWAEHRAGSSTTIPASQTSLTKTSYTEGGATYNHVTCSFNRPFPTVTGTYTYSVIISPGSVTPTVPGSNTIVPPAKPSTDCPAGFIKQGDTLRCTCSTTNPGTPPATVTWDGQSGAQLEVTGVTSSDNNKQYTCQVRWGNRVVHDTTYTLRVACE